MVNVGIYILKFRIENSKILLLGLIEVDFHCVGVVVTLGLDRLLRLRSSLLSQLEPIPLNRRFTANHNSALSPSFLKCPQAITRVPTRFDFKTLYSRKQSHISLAKFKNKKASLDHLK